MIHHISSLYGCGDRSDVTEAWMGVTCLKCLEKGAESWITPRRKLAMLTGDVVHASGGGTWCGKGKAGTGTWAETTCLECLDAGGGSICKSYADKIRAGLYPGVGVDGRYIVAKSMIGKYPHKCPRCSGPAYIGFTTMDCSKGCK